MAEVIVHSLLLRLGDETLQEAIILYNAHDEVESVKRQLTEISYYLKDADAKRRKGDNSVIIVLWAHEVREVAFQIEDAIDTFLLNFERHSRNNIVKRAIINPFIDFFHRNRFSKTIHTIEAKLQEIDNRRERYNIRELLETEERAFRRSIETSVVAQEIDLVGFDAEMKQMIGLLLGDTGSRNVVSITGPGGCGKTALAQNIYRSEQIRNHFDVLVWLYATHGRTRANLLTQILENLRNTAISENEHDEYYLSTQVTEQLGQKKYLIVLDDLCELDLWTQLDVNLPKFPNASRVLITTRSFGIARAVANYTTPLELRSLDEEESLKLLLKKAFLGKNFNEVCLRGICTKFSEKCDGLPLALVAVGSLLWTKDPNSWDHILSTMDWNTDAYPCLEVLNSSCEDLPIKLKACFMYFASFPDHYEHNADLLCWLWISEGFMPHDSRRTMEEIAHEYIEEFAQRHVIKVLKKSDDGSIQHFMVRGLLHKLAIREAEQNKFVNIFSNQEDSERFDIATRGIFGLDNTNWDKASFKGKNPMEYTNWKVRTLVFFGKVIPFNSRFQLLRVLVINDYNCPPNGVKDLGKSLKRLFRLRCLVFKECVFKLFVLPVDLLHHLQTLVISNCTGIEVPMSLWRIKTLRHVFVNDESTISVGSEPLNLPNLQILKKVSINESGTELSNMPNLREVHLCNEHDSWEPIMNLLAESKILVSLGLEAITIPLEIINAKTHPYFNGLHTLYLSGVWPVSAAIDSSMFPPNLTILKLVNSQIDQNLMLVLEQLPKLNVLSLFGAYNGKQLISSNGGFKTLLKLELSWIYKLEEWMIEEGAMPVLRDLTVCYCRKLRTLPNLRHVPTLNALTLRFMPTNFKSMMQNEEEQQKFKHIPSVIIKDE